MGDLRIKGDIGQMFSPANVKARRQEAGAAQRAASRKARRAGATGARVGMKAERVLVTTGTLGASPRKGWRLSGEAGRNARKSDARFVAHPEPMAYITQTRKDALGKESITPRSNLVAVAFETRRDHKEGRK